MRVRHGAHPLGQREHLLRPALAAPEDHRVVERVHQAADVVDGLPPGEAVGDGGLGARVVGHQRERERLLAQGADPGVVPAVNDARRALKSAIAEKLDASHETQEAMAAILRDAADAIRALDNDDGGERS